MIKELIYNRIRQRVFDKMSPFANEDYIDEVTNSIIEITKVDKLLDTLNRISLAKMYDSDELFPINSYSAHYWRDKSVSLIDMAEDVLLEMYNER